MIKTHLEQQLRMRFLKLFFFEKRFCKMDIEVINERSHKKCGDNGAESGNRGKHGELSARKQVKRAAEKDTGKVGGDPAVFKRSNMSFVCQHQRDRIVGGDAEVCCEIKG